MHLTKQRKREMNMKNLNEATATQTTRQSVYAGTGTGRVVLFTTGSNADVVVGNPPFEMNTEIFLQTKTTNRITTKLESSLVVHDNDDKIIFDNTPTEDLPAMFFTTYDETKQSNDWVCTEEMKSIKKRIRSIQKRMRNHNTAKRSMEQLEHQLKCSRVRLRIASVEELYPEADRLTTDMKKSGVVGIVKGTQMRSIAMLNDIDENGALFDSFDVEEYDMGFRKITSKFCVVTNRTPNYGQFKTVIIECTPSIGFGQGVATFGVESRDEAEQLVSHLNDPQVMAKVNELLIAAKTSQMNNDLMGRLPTFKEA